MSTFHYSIGTVLIILGIFHIILGVKTELRKKFEVNEGRYVFTLGKDEIVKFREVAGWTASEDGSPIVVLTYHRNGASEPGLSTKDNENIIKPEPVKP